MSKVPSKVLAKVASKKKNVLAKVVEYCSKHAAATGSSSSGEAAEGGSETRGVVVGRGQ